MTEGSSWKFCRDPLWDPSLTWYTDNPDLTECARNTVLVLAPLAGLALACPLWLMYVQRVRVRHRRRISWIFCCKLVLTFVLTASAFMKFSLVLLGSGSPDGAKQHFLSDYVFVIGLGATFSLALYVQVREVMLGVSNSALMTSFWFLFLLCTVPTTKVDLEATESTPAGRLLACCYVTAVCLQVVLHCLPENQAEDASIPPEDRATFLSYLLFGWMDQTLRVGWTRALEKEDLPSTPDSVGREENLQDFADAWSPSERQAHLGKIFTVLARLHWKRWLLAYVLGIASVSLIFAKPHLLKCLIGHVTSDEEQWKGILYASLLLITHFFCTLLLTHCSHQLTLVGIQVQNELLSAVYMKQSVLSESSRRLWPPQKVARVVSSTAKSCCEVFPRLHHLTNGPMQVAMATHFLFEEMGTAALVGIATLVLSLWVHSAARLGEEKRQGRIRSVRGKRTSLEREMLENIEVVKTGAWEEPFMTRANAIRDTEVQLLGAVGKLNSVSYFAFLGGIFLATLVTFAVYFYTDSANSDLTLEKILVTIAIFKILQDPIQCCPEMLFRARKLAALVESTQELLCADEVTVDDDANGTPSPSAAGRSSQCAAPLGCDAVPDREVFRTNRLPPRDVLPETAAGRVRFPMTLATLTLGELARLGAIWWVSFWTAPSSPSVEPAFLLGIFACIGVIGALLTSLGRMRIGTGCASVSGRLYRKMLYCVMRSPMSFFDSTPVSSVLSRFGHDLTTVDSELPKDLLDFLRLLITLVSTLAVISVVIPRFLVAVAPLATVYLLVWWYFLRSPQQLRTWRRFNSTDVLAAGHDCAGHGGEQLPPGARVEEEEEHFHRLETFHQYHYCVAAAGRWLEVRNGLIGALEVFSASILLALHRSAVNGGEAGMAILLSLEMADALTPIMHAFFQLDNDSGSLQKILEYSCNVHEDEWEKVGDPDHPLVRGRVQLKSFSISSNSVSLRNLNVDICEGEKIGMVDRSGLGKDKLIVRSLLRLAEPPHRGLVLLDNTDITTLGLHKLRSSIEVIPAKPMLFSGTTLRFNLDPGNSAGEDLLWEALSQVKLSDHVDRQCGGLDHVVRPPDDCLSVGQRRLFCLAKALLKRKKLIIVMEASELVSQEEDEQMAEAIQTACADCTTITVADSVDKVANSGRTLVLKDDSVEILDCPEELLVSTD